MQKLFFILVLFLVMPFSLIAMDKQSSKSIIIMLGAPGSGKGTQAVQICDTLHLPQISTGDLFRENLKQNTPIGQKAKSYMEKGELVPDEVVLEMLFLRLAKEDCKKGYVLDGFPRTLAQADQLEKSMDKGAELIVLSLEVPDEMIIERLAGRLSCEKCGAPYHKSYSPPKCEGVCDRCQGKVVQREDDREEVIRKRLLVFHEQSEPLKEHYQKMGVLTTIDATHSKEKTRADIVLCLENRGK